MKAGHGDRALEKLVALARHELTDELSPRDHAGRERLAHVTDGIARRRRPWVPRAALASVAFASLVVGATWIVRHQVGSARLLEAGAGAALGEVPLTYEVAGPASTQQGLIKTQGSAPATIRFSEGTSLALAPDARALIRTVSAHGAEVRLETGNLHAEVTPLPAARWSVEAGPYTVRVTGTAFDVTWSPAHGQLDVSLHRGHVVVSGPMAPQGIPMVAGQHLTANPDTGVLQWKGPGPGTAEAQPTRSETARTQATGEAEPAERPSAVSSVASPTGGLRTARGTRSASAASLTGSSPPSWAALLGRGDFPGVVAAAEAKGIKQVARNGSASDLAALADAARYLRRTSLATQILTAERERFGDSPAARDAAFFLGGLAEEQGQATGWPRAIKWYTRYLGDEPHGAYRAQAQGRLMVLLARLGREEEARAAARAYLAADASGPYATKAKALLAP